MFAIPLGFASTRNRITYEELILSHSPVGYYRLEETSGTTLTDIIAARNGTFVGSPTLNSTGIVDKCVVFNGTNQYGTVPYTSAYDLSSLSIEFWIKTPSATNTFKTVLSKGAGANRNYWCTLWSGNTAPHNQDGIMVFRNITTITGTSVDIPTTVRLDDNAWHHYVVTFDSSSGVANAYVDGVLNNTLTGKVAGGSGGSSPTYFMSETASTRFCSGSLDEVAIYNYALTGTQVAEHYAAA